jgi:hypothetical protein
LRDGKIILSGPPRKINNGAPDPDRIPFGDELSLRTLSPGKYSLMVTITDAVSGTAVSQTVDFEVI